MDKAPDHATDLDPDLLAEALEPEELLDDPLDSLAMDCPDPDAEIRTGLAHLRGGRDEVMQGLRIFCEYRDHRAIPLLLPQLHDLCPITRMSAVYALGRNPTADAESTLLQLLQDSNGFVRKAVAWSLGNYPGAAVLQALIRALTTDIAAVRLWAASSLVDVAVGNPADAVRASQVLREALRIDNDAVVRSNCAWSLSRLHGACGDNPTEQQKLVQALIQAMLGEPDQGVAEDARTALEQLDDPASMARIKVLLDDGLLN
ncbi:MAG: HEAT repeat domain-containing protein [Cyanobacteria bacterium MAG CAR3_bin_5]|nr:HEAT repeat domain-containing protein [Cyanobacteria bacterium MAG CAR4_bin_6]MCY4173103.1 HEAT repeat domain-containing protein [Cyanobacteria bacterium MAG CAR3_bin_5]MCY4236355.1 HEAT repeat domain-containing protein [Cyanobacteria bacterium MAG CAR2_bin_4]